MLYEVCLAEDQAKFLSKGYKALLAIADRADPDWPDEWAETFMKGQSITKPGCYDRDAKMGQLVISFSTAVNFKFGALARYVAHSIHAMMPPHFFWLDGKTDADLSAFVQHHWDFAKLSSEDDYTAFDSTQGGEFLNYDCDFLSALGVPQPLINSYLNFMVSIRTWIGKMGYMMPSGCKFTLAFNSTRSAAYQALKYRLSYATPICITGDDVACNGTPPERPTWSRDSKHFRLVSKRAQRLYPTFCGWILTPAGAVKDPELLLLRTMFQQARGNLPLCVYSYAADSTPLHKNFEAAHPFLDEHQIECHFTLRQLLTAEAQACGIRLKGKFDTTFGTSRTYDLTLNGGSQTILAHSIKLLSTPITMPYRFLNSDHAANLYSARWVTTRAADELCVKLNSIDYSVVDNRRKMHLQLTEFQSAMILGEELFDEDKQFPEGFRHRYLTTADSTFSRLLTSLSNNLSYRSTTVAKDTDQATQQTGNNRAPQVSASGAQGRNQEDQDNFKRYEELTNQFCTYANMPGNVWSRGTFALRCPAVWTEPDQQQQQQGNGDGAQV
jgi:hypothetical protein